MKQQRNVFDSVGNLHPPRSQFNLSHEKKFTCDMGELIPVQCDEVVPADFWEMGAQMVCRFQPLVAPCLHEINAISHSFFVPYRILWNAQTREDFGNEDPPIVEETGNWEEFITGGLDGDSTPTLPTWEPTSLSEGSLWDYLGFPIDIDCDGCYPNRS